MMIITIVAHLLKIQVGHEKHVNRYIAFGLIVLRYCSQITRFVVLLWRTKEENAKTIDEIVLNEGKVDTEE